MTKTEGIVMLTQCRQAFTASLENCICEYAQYGLTLPEIEACIDKQDYKQAKSRLLSCLACCPNAELPIVNPDGELARIMWKMVRRCENLIKNQELTEQIQKI